MGTHTNSMGGPPIDDSALRKHFNRDGSPKKDLGVCLDNFFIDDSHLGRSAASYEDHSPRIFSCVRVHRADEVFRIAHGLSWSAGFASVEALACTYSPPSLRMRQKWIAIKKVAVNGRITQCRT